MHHIDLMLPSSGLESTFASLVGCPFVWILRDKTNISEVGFFVLLPWFWSLIHKTHIIKIIGPSSLISFSFSFKTIHQSQKTSKSLLALLLFLSCLPACPVPNYRYSAITVKFTAARLQLNWFSSHFQSNLTSQALPFFTVQDQFLT